MAPMIQKGAQSIKRHHAIEKKKNKKRDASPCDGSIPFEFGYGADGRTRTVTALATAPSRQRVYQFHHIR